MIGSQELGAGSGNRSHSVLLVWGGGCGPLPAPRSPLPRYYWTPALLLLLATLTTTSCAKSSSVSSAPPPGMDISGRYEWRDAFDVNTGCLVQIFWQDEEYRGWVTTDQDTTVECPWRGYELREVEFQGGQVRLSVVCPRAGCPDAIARGGAEYLLDVVPAFFISGRLMGGSQVWRGSPRWAKMTLVPRGTGSWERGANRQGAVSGERNVLA